MLGQPFLSLQSTTVIERLFFCFYHKLIKRNCDHFLTRYPTDDRCAIQDHEARVNLGPRLAIRSGGMTFNGSDHGRVDIHPSCPSYFLICFQLLWRITSASNMPFQTALTRKLGIKSDDLNPLDMPNTHSNLPQFPWSKVECNGISLLDSSEEARAECLILSAQGWIRWTSQRREQCRRPRNSKCIQWHSLSIPFLSESQHWPLCSHT